MATTRKETLQARLLDVNAAAAYLQVSSWSVRVLVWRGALPHVRIGRLLRLDRSDLDGFIEANKARNGQ